MLKYGRVKLTFEQLIKNVSGQSNQGKGMYLSRNKAINRDGKSPL